VPALLAATPVGTGFVYQATISDGTGPVSGSYDLHVTLFDAADGGSVVGGPLDFTDLSISNGLAILQLDFGGIVEDADRWLELEVRPAAGTGDFTRLTPRQRLHPTPYASYALEAVSAASADSSLAAGDADTLDGQHGAYYLSWSSHTAIPAGLDDGDDDSLGELACAPGEVPTWGATGWVCGEDHGTVFARTTVVRPVGDALANGAALLAAVAAITTPTSREEAWRVEIEPGLYDLGGAALELRPWVDMAGAGREVTTVTSSICSDGLGALTGTVALAAYAELRDLAVVNTCSGTTTGIAVAIDDDAFFARVTRVNARAIDSGGPDANFRYSLANLAAGVVLEDVISEARDAVGINSAFVSVGDQVLVVDCIGSAEGGDYAFGLWLSDDNVEMSTTVSRGSFRATASGTTYAVYINTVTASLNQVTAVADGAALYIANYIGDNTVRASRLTATGPVEASAAGGSLDVLIAQSRVVATGPSVTLGGVAVMHVAATQLWGAPVVGSVMCSGVWDESWVFYSGTCP